MRWPFGKRPSHPTAGPAGAETTAGSTELARAATPRRDWATLPALRPATAKPIQLTAAPRAFTDSLASRQPLVRNPAMAHVRRIDAPSGSLRGVLHAAIDQAPETALPDMQAASPLPAVEHRSAPAIAPGLAQFAGAAAIEHLLSLPSGAGDAVQPDEQGLAAEAAAAPERPVVASPPDATTGRGSLADSRRRGLGPAYHGPLPEAMQAEHERVVHAEPLPPDLRSTMHDVLGVDVGDRLVHRGPAVSAEAESMGATAFARAGEVFVSDDVGGLDTSAGRAAVAHELTHVVQQRTRTVLPAESSADGIMLEAQAQRVEQYVRGDAAAPKPPPALLHATPVAPQDAAPCEPDVVATTQQLMREMVDSGLARPDGSGGIVFTQPPSSMTQSGVQRQTSAAAPATGRDSPSHSSNWNRGETFVHNLGSAFAHDSLTIASSAFGFSDEFANELHDEVKAEDKAFADRQTRAATRRMKKEHFAETRLEHLRTSRLRTVHEQEDAAHRPRSYELPRDVLNRLERAVDDEVAQRVALFEQQYQRALTELNTSARTRGQEPAAELPDASYDRAWNLLFDHPDGDTRPTPDQVHHELTAEPASRTPAQPTQGSGGGAPAQPAATAASTTAAASSAAAAAHHDSPAARGEHPTTGANGQPAAQFGAQAPAPAGGAGAASTASSTGAGLGQTEEPPTRGDHWRLVGEGDNQQRMWSGERNQTIGQNFNSMGRHLLGDVLHQETEIFGSLFGFSDDFQKEIDEGIDSDLRIAPSDRGKKARGGAGATATGDESKAATSASSTVDQIARDPYALAELALRLYPNIRSRLRQELLVDRERAGLLTDFR